LGGVPFAVIGGIGGHFIGGYQLTIVGVLFGLIAGQFVTGLPIDKYLDEHFRHLVEIKDENQQPPLIVRDD
jgi:outer membrane lipoprotein SlyB